MEYELCYVVATDSTVPSCDPDQEFASTTFCTRAESRYARTYSSSQPVRL